MQSKTGNLVNYQHATILVTVTTILPSYFNYFFLVATEGSKARQKTKKILMERQHFDTFNSYPRICWGFNRFTLFHCIPGKPSGVCKTKLTTRSSRVRLSQVYKALQFLGFKEWYPTPQWSLNSGPSGPSWIDCQSNCENCESSISINFIHL